MEPIRVSTISQLAGAPYQFLRQVPEIHFEEGSPTENAEKLLRGKVDAALIPAIDFAVRGSYHSLGFGLGCRSRSQSMVLYAQNKLEELESISIYQCSSSSSGLLKLLLCERGGRVPPFVREQRLAIKDRARERVGALVLHEKPGALDRSYPVCLDLATTWHAQTGLPFVFLIWAVRPRALSAAQLTLLTDSLYRSLQVDRHLARGMAADLGVTPEQAEEFVGDDRRYYLDDFLLAGLEEYLARTQRRFLLPKIEYRVVKKYLFGGVVTRPTPNVSFPTRANVV